VLYGAKEKHGILIGSKTLLNLSISGGKLDIQKNAAKCKAKNQVIKI